MKNKNSLPDLQKKNKQKKLPIKNEKIKIQKRKDGAYFIRKAKSVRFWT